MALDGVDEFGEMTKPCEGLCRDTGIYFTELLGALSELMGAQCLALSNQLTQQQV